MSVPGAIRLAAPDLLRLAVHGLQARPLRVALSALGIAIGIGAMLAVVGISASSREELNRKLDALGTNLLTVQPGTGFTGDQATLPDEAPTMARHMRDVQAVSVISALEDLKAYRHNRIPLVETGGMAVYATMPDLLPTLGAEVVAGRWLDAALIPYPAVVLGERAAARLGATADHVGQQVWIGQRWVTIVGILAPVTLAPSLDFGIFMGWPAAVRYFDADAEITTMYVRVSPDRVEKVADLLASTANPSSPNEVQVSRPSDMLAAQAAADLAFTGLLVGLGAVALLVGGIGVVNTMVISVLERRAEIGLRRSQGATRGHIRLQFLSEALVLSAAGGAAGIVIGALVTLFYSAVQDWPVALPPWAIAGGMGATLVIGGVGGLYPAMRAARLAPTEALTYT
jgi:putative ABC transport system permease protein